MVVVPGAFRLAPALLARCQQPVALLASSTTVVDEIGTLTIDMGGSILGGLLAVFGLPLFSLVVVVVGYVWKEQYMLDLRAQSSGKSKRRDRSVEPSSSAYLRPSDTKLWTPAQLSEFDGSKSEAPILLAADGLVFNVAKARNMYGPGSEYAVMAGKDASRYLARNSVEEETEEEAGANLNVAQQASLSMWVLSLKSKYDVVGRLASVEEATAMAQREAYMDEMERRSWSLEDASDSAREKLESVLALEAEPGRDS